MSGLGNERENPKGIGQPASTQRHRRVSIRVPIRISTIDPEKDPSTGKLFFFTSDEFSADISRGGVFVVTPEPIEPGRRLLVEVEIPGGSNIQTIGRVVWKRIETGQAGASPRDRHGVGVQFTSGRPDLFNELERYVEKQAGRRRGVSKINRGTQIVT